MMNMNGSINSSVCFMSHVINARLITMPKSQVATNVLSMLTRMRQLALHPGLVPSNYLEQLKAADEHGDAKPTVHVTPGDKVRLQALLSQIIEDCEECPICFSILIDPRITSCAHTFCLPCISEVISRDPKCPMVSVTFYSWFKYFNLLTRTAVQ